MTITKSLSPENLLDYVDDFRIEAYSQLNNAYRAKLGQFFTPPTVAKTMASMPEQFPRQVRLLDPGAGVGILSAAYVSSCLQVPKQGPQLVEVVAYEIESTFKPYLQETMMLCAELCTQYGVEFRFTVHDDDFVVAGVDMLQQPLLQQEEDLFNVVILNPPYRKIRANSTERRALSRIDIETSNLYTAFMWLAARLLVPGGVFVSITPRSFCNGPYFRPFRQSFLSEMSVKQIHIYGSREETFVDDKVLQENIIVYSAKTTERGDVRITSSSGPEDKDVTTHAIDHDELVRPEDPDSVVYIPTNGIDAQVRQIMHRQQQLLSDLGISVSTGRVVDFRAKELLRQPGDDGTVPLIYPGHLQSGFVQWPIIPFKKPSAIDYAGSAAKLLVPEGFYVVVKRFSAKEEKRRVAAAIYDPTRIYSTHVGFENHLNYYHQEGRGLSADLAKGLAAYLNSTLVDEYFRQFSGHTQVNATDLRGLKYPNSSSLKRLGGRIGEIFPSQKDLDQLVLEELGMSEQNDPLNPKRKIEEALEILKAVSVPRGQQNERSALTLLAILDLRPDDDWSQAAAPLRGITEMMDYFSDHYGVNYAPNTRETVRRQTIHQFWQLGMVIPNPDKPDRPINSPKYCYQVSDELLILVQQFGSDDWDRALAHYRDVAADKLRSLQTKKREMLLIPVRLPDGSEVEITAGGQNELIKYIVEEFCPRFTKGGQVVYLGDAGGKLTQEQLERFKELGVELDEHGKIPDVIVYMQDKNWLILIEAVTSHGPIDIKRHNELQDLFGECQAGLVFVTAFKSRREMTKYLSEISWETEVWVADAPSHLIHFDGERFLGPYSEK